MAFEYFIFAMMMPVDMKVVRAIGFIMYPAKLWTLASNIGIHIQPIEHGSGFVRWVIAPFIRHH
jgi:hypothetical protein